MIYELIETLAAILGLTPQETAGWLLISVLFIVLLIGTILKWRRQNRRPYTY